MILLAIQCMRLFVLSDYFSNQITCQQFDNDTLHVVGMYEALFISINAIEIFQMLIKVVLVEITSILPSQLSLI